MWPNQYPFKSCHDQEQSSMVLMYLDLNRVALSPFVTRSLIIVLTPGWCPTNLSALSNSFVVPDFVVTETAVQCGLARRVVDCFTSGLAWPGLPASQGRAGEITNWRLRSEVRFW